MRIYELSRTPLNGNIYIDVKSNTLYRTNYLPPHEEKIRPPFFFSVLGFYILFVVCFSIFGISSVYSRYFYVIDLVWIVSLGIIVYTRQKKISHAIKKGTVIDITNINNDEYRKLLLAVKRSSIVMYHTVDRFLSSFYFLGFASFILASFLDKKFYSQFLHTGIITLVFIAYLKTCSCCRKRKEIYNKLTQKYRQA